MSNYQPNKDDRVRFVIEDEVTYVGSESSVVVLADGHVIDPEAKSVVSVEKIAPPLPTKAGTIIVSRFGDTAFRTSRGWIGESGVYFEPAEGHWTVKG